MCEFELSCLFPCACNIWSNKAWFWFIQRNSAWLLMDAHRMESLIPDPEQFLLRKCTLEWLIGSSRRQERFSRFILTRGKSFGSNQWLARNSYDVFASLINSLDWVQVPYNLLVLTCFCQLRRFHSHSRAKLIASRSLKHYHIKKNLEYWRNLSVWTQMHYRSTASRPRKWAILTRSALKRVTALWILHAHSSHFREFSSFSSIALKHWFKYVSPYFQEALRD